jgi:predicted unusual protein kinase regulating ubiquinone biosynthesis (AarF/ABC1/UbiB family)
LGTGSIGQVHELLPRNAPDDESVVVKISFHDEHWKMREDFAVMAALGANTGVDRASVLFRSLWLFIQDSIKQIEGEFDMLREANFTRTGKEIVDTAQTEVKGYIEYAFGVKRSVIPTLTVPVVIDAPSSQALVLQRVSGVPLLAFLDSLPEGQEKDQAQTAAFGSIFMWVGWMIFAKGFYHGDPHPGQFLVQPEENRLWLLDWGLSQELSKQQRRDLHELYYLMHFCYDAATLRPRILDVAPAVLEYLAGRLAMERVVFAAVSDMDTHHRHRIATVMRRMGFATSRDSDLSLTVGAFGLFDTNIAFNDVELLNKWTQYDAVVNIPGEYLVLTRMVQTIGGLARRLQGAKSTITSRNGARWHFSELSNVRLWRHFVQNPLH